MLQILLLHAHAASVSHKLEVYTSKERRLLQNQVQLGIGVKT